MGPQNAVQQALGLHTTAQNGVGNPNNGNPNTVYNTAAPTTTTTGPNATAPWIGTMAANPINMPFNATGLLPGTMQAGPIQTTNLLPPPNLGAGGGNSAVSDILNRIRGGNFGLPTAGVPGTGTPPPTTGPTPTAPVPGTGAIGTPVGPISGPIHQDVNAWQRNYLNAQPRTSIEASGNGRWGNLPWMPVNPTGPQWNQRPIGSFVSQEQANPVYEQAVSKFGDWGRKAVDFLMGKDFMPDVTGQNGWQGALSQFAGMLVPGGNFIVDKLLADNSERDINDPAFRQLVSSKINDQLSGLMNTIQTKSGEDARTYLDNLLNGNGNSSIDYRGYYNSQPAMSRTDWNRTVDRSRFIGMFENGQAHDTVGRLTQELQDRFDRVAITRPRRVMR